MTTRYMTAAEYEALSDEALYVMKMSGDEVVIVEDTGPEPSAKEHVPDVSFSFMPTAGKAQKPISPAPASQAAPTPQAAPAPDAPNLSGLMQQMIALQQQTLAEVQALRAALVRNDGAAEAPAASENPVEALQDLMQALDHEIAKQQGEHG